MWKGKQHERTQEQQEGLSLLGTKQQDRVTEAAGTPDRDGA